MKNRRFLSVMAVMLCAVMLIGIAPIQAKADTDVNALRRPTTVPTVVRPRAEVEPNDELYAADYLSTSETREGTLTKGDFDFYYMNLYAGHTYTLKFLNGAEEMTSAYVYLMYPDESLSEDLAYEICFGMTFECTQSGTYFLQLGPLNYTMTINYSIALYDEAEQGHGGYGGWVQDSKGWRFQLDDGSFVYNMRGTWSQTGDDYIFTPDGYMATGWYMFQGDWYYLGSNGVVRFSWQKVNGVWYYLGNDGVMQTNWKQIDGKWYYFGTDGAMRTGWQKVGSNWYYLGSDGAMRTNWIQDGGKWYYMGNDGAMKTGWQKVGGVWYYLKNEMKTGWQKIDNIWYYMASNGAMATGWKMIDGTWYYFKASGAMAYSETLNIGGTYYTFASNGAWVK